MPTDTEKNMDIAEYKNYASNREHPKSIGHCKCRFPFHSNQQSDRGSSAAVCLQSKCDDILCKWEISAVQKRLRLLSAFRNKKRFKKCHLAGLWLFSEKSQSCSPAKHALTFMTRTNSVWRTYVPSNSGQGSGITHYSYFQSSLYMTWTCSIQDLTRTFADHNISCYQNLYNLQRPARTIR